MTEPDLTTTQLEVLFSSTIQCPDLKLKRIDLSWDNVVAVNPNTVVSAVRKVEKVYFRRFEDKLDFDCFEDIEEILEFAYTE